MLVNTKAKVGVFSIALGAYLPQFPSLVPEFEAQYDAEAKLLLAQKPFLANILVRTVKDYMGLNPCDVEELIEGEPYISTIPVEPGFTNSVQIKGMNSENKVRNEGVAYFDILFYVRTSDGLSKVIINIEAQKSEPIDYDVEMRGLYYAIREVSSQLDLSLIHI